ncbi:MAG: polyamine ABC transporter ATP-binding protein [Candidatus Paracaedibacteraceae bacterium]|nr:polyamine ABC transporter ATP-binding protein [Candidatus Paracaedibacteraceae bacterium]
MQHRTGQNVLELWQDPTAKPYIQLENISKSFDNIHAVKNLNLSVYKGELFSLLGASGCGKTTLLRILAGFENPTSGRILIDGIDITNWPAYKRPVNMMFQSYALFPHMTVFQNIAFGLKQERMEKSEIKQRVFQVLELVQMASFADRKPNQLSGGQKQRVALARSLVKQPKLVLLDEPMAALDKKLREQTQFELVNIQEKVGVTFIVVTHDQEEAMTMSTRMAIMEEGRIRQIGVPHDIYEFPNSRYVAEFIGTMNVFNGVVIADEPDHVVIDAPEAGGQLYITHTAAMPLGAHVSVAIRPEKITISTISPDEYPLQTFQEEEILDESNEEATQLEQQMEVPLKRNCAKGIVREIGYLGDMSIYHIELESGKRVQAAMTNLLRLTDRDVKWDDEVYLYWRPENGIVLTG